MNFAGLFDRLDRALCRAGVVRSATWDDVVRSKVGRLYAGGLYRSLPQFETHFGISPFERSTRNINHDLCEPMPIADSSIDLFQSEDVFEHIPYAELPPIIAEIYRILRCGGLFRLSVPDYRCPVLLERTQRNDAGDLLFDPAGGGALVDGKVTDGGHVWFPIYENVKALFEGSRFATGGSVKFLHYTKLDGESFLEPIDYSLGHVQRTPDHDERVQSPRRAMSIVVDAIKSE